MSGRYGNPSSWNVVRELSKRGMGPNGPIQGPVRYVSRTSYELSRATVTGRVRSYPLAGTETGRVSTVWLSTRIGIQTHTALVSLVRTTFIRAPGTVLQFGKYAVRSAVRDAMLPYNSGVHAYQLVRADRLARGLTSRAELAADRYLVVSGRLLDRVGLAPRLSGTVGSVIRIGIVGAAVEGIASVRGRIDYARGELESLYDRLMTARAGQIPAGTPAQPTPEPVRPMPTAPVVQPPPAPPTRPTASTPGQGGRGSTTPPVYLPVRNR